MVFYSTEVWPPVDPNGIKGFSLQNLRVGNMPILMDFSLLSSYFSLSVMENNAMTCMITKEILVHIYTQAVMIIMLVNTHALLRWH